MSSFHAGTANYTLSISFMVCNSMSTVTDDARNDHTAASVVIGYITVGMSIILVVSSLLIMCVFVLVLKQNPLLSSLCVYYYKLRFFVAANSSS